MPTPGPKGVAYGRDKRGRLYKTINGKHVKVSQDAAPKERKAEPDTHTPVHREAVKELAEKFLPKNASAEEAEDGIASLLQTRFWPWFIAKSSSPEERDAKLYAAKLILTRLRSALKITDSET